MTVRPFTIHVPDQVLADLRRRLELTRLPDELPGAGWDYGTDTAYLRDLLAYWRDGFDWRAREADLNGFDQVLVEVEGLDVHMLRRPGTDSSAAPVLLLHGWPDGVVRYRKLLDRLPEHDLLVPSLPGYGFSGIPRERGFGLARMAQVLVPAARELGYERMVVHGGDIGTGVGVAMAQLFPDFVAGLHLTDVPARGVMALDPGELSEAELRWTQEIGRWLRSEGAYSMLQATKPQTAGTGLNDSPAGLAAWIVEKFRAWSDCGGDVESRFSKDELLTDITVYWVTQTITSSFRAYFEPHRGWSDPPLAPTGFALFPADISRPPRELAERYFRVARWTELPRGGHFAALEEPDLLAGEIAAFAASL